MESELSDYGTLRDQNKTRTKIELLFKENIKSTKMKLKDIKR